MPRTSRKSRKSRKVLTKAAALALAASTRTAKVQLHLCVRAVLKRMKTKDSRAVSRAFAICTASLQKNGYLRKGSNEPTVKGKARATLMKRRKDTLDKLAEFEQILARAGVDRRKSRRSRRSRK